MTQYETTGRTTIALNITAEVAINPASELPELPEGVPTPKVTFDFGDDDGKLYTYLNFPVDEWGFSIHFWINEEGEGFNSIYAGGEVAPWDDEALELVLEYGNTIAGRIASKIEVINGAIVRSAVAKQIIDSALGRPTGGSEITVPAYLVQVGDELVGDNGSHTTVTDVDDSSIDPAMVYFDTEFGRIYREKSYEVTVIRS